MKIAKIPDFGVVKPIAPAEVTQNAGQTGSAVLVDTLKYMSPEQLRGEKRADSRDISALAVVSYEMLAGTHAFATSTALDMHDAVLPGRVVRQRTRMPGAPSGWQHFFGQAISKRVESAQSGIANANIRCITLLHGALIPPQQQSMKEAPRQLQRGLQYPEKSSLLMSPSSTPASPSISFMAATMAGGPAV